MKKIMMILSALGMVMPVLAEAQEPLAKPRVSEAVQVEQAPERRMEATKSSSMEASPAKLKVKRAKTSRVQIGTSRDAATIQNSEAEVKPAKKFEPTIATPVQMTPARKTTEKK